METTAKRLLDHCRALLSPSFAGGFRLPVAEALTAGPPVLASDIPPFREQDDGAVIYLDPLSVADWRQAIVAMTAVPAPARPLDAAAKRHSIGDVVLSRIRRLFARPDLLVVL